MNASENKTVEQLCDYLANNGNSVGEPITVAMPNLAELIRAANKRDLAELRSLVKELSDALDSELNADCQTCGNHSCVLKDEFACPDIAKNKELVKKAREVLGEDYCNS